MVLNILLVVLCLFLVILSLSAGAGPEGGLGGTPTQPAEYIYIQLRFSQRRETS